MIAIPLKHKYLTGRAYKTQKSAGTPNGGDAFLNKSAKKHKLNATAKAKLPPQRQRAKGLFGTKVRTVDL